VTLTPLDVACPYCSAEPGDPCVGRTITLHSPHVERATAAVERDQLLGKLRGMLAAHERVAAGVAEDGTGRDDIAGKPGTEAS